MQWFKPGRRMMTVGSIALLLTATMHTVAHFSPLPDEPQLNAVVESMHQCRIEAGFGMRPTVAEILESTSLSMSVFLAMIGLGNLLVVGHPSVARSLVRSLAALNAVAMATLVAVYYAHSFPQPLVNFAILTVIFLAALVLPGRAPVADRAS